jgi:hypothetical protein
VVTHLVARRPTLSKSSAFARRTSVDSLRGHESEGSAHFEFTRINIAPTILRNTIEDWREVGALEVTSSKPSAKRFRGTRRRGI